MPWCSPPDSSVHGILPANILEWVAFPEGNPSSGDLLDPGIELMSLGLLYRAGGFFTNFNTWENPLPTIWDHLHLLSDQELTQDGPAICLGFSTKGKSPFPG